MLKREVLQVLLTLRIQTLVGILKQTSGWNPHKLTVLPLFAKSYHKVTQSGTSSCNHPGNVVSISSNIPKHFACVFSILCKTKLIQKNKPTWLTLTKWKSPAGIMVDENSEHEQWLSWPMAFLTFKILRTPHSSIQSSDPFGHPTIVFECREHISRTSCFSGTWNDVQYIH